MSSLSKEQKKSFLWKIAIILLAVLFVYYIEYVRLFLLTAWTIISPFLLGFGIAYIWTLLLNPVERLLFSDKRNKVYQKLRRPVSLIVSLLIFLGIIALVLYLIIPQVYESIRIIADGFPHLTKEFQQWFLVQTEGLEWTKDLRTKVQEIEINWPSVFENAWAYFETSIGGILGSTVSAIKSVIGVFVAGFTAIIFSVYLVLKKEKLLAQVARFSKAYLPKHLVKNLRYVFSVLHENFSAFFKGQVIDAFAVGLMLFIAMLIFRFPYALTISVVVMVTALIPMVGSFIGGALGFLMISAVDFRQGMFFIILLIVVQQLEGDVVYPKIVGDAIGLPGMWVFISVIVGGAIAGPLGMVLSVPTVASAYKILRRDMHTRLSNMVSDEEINADLQVAKISDREEYEAKPDKETRCDE